MTTRAGSYMARVLRHIPAEIVMTYVSIDGVLRTTYSPNLWNERRTLSILLWIVLAALTILTPLWLWRVRGIESIPRLFISTLSVPVWLFALGGPFALLDWYEPAFGAIVLPLYTLIVPIVIRSTR